MGQVYIDTNKLWDIGKICEATQKKTVTLAESLKKVVKSLNFVEDILQLHDEQIEKQIKLMNSQAHRCGMAASYIFTMARMYEEKETELQKNFGNVNVVIFKDEKSDDGTSDQTNAQVDSTWEYKIKRGDTLWAIAKKYNTTVDELVKINNIPNRDLIYAGATLLIPVSGVPSNAGSNTSGSTAIHTENKEQNSDSSSTPLQTISSCKLTDAQIDEMMNRLKNNTSLKLSKEKKEALTVFGKLLLKEGYEPSFVAGLLGNISSEGSVGKFESSCYIGNNAKNKPNYLIKMDSIWNYADCYSGKKIEDVNLNDVYNMVHSLENQGYTNGKFGLGSIQWTGSRCTELVDIYKEVAGSSSNITHEQVLQAEEIMLSRELNGRYSRIYKNWLAGNTDTLSISAVQSAGSDLCKSYFKPKNIEAESVTRGNIACDIYKVMLGL